MSKIQVDRKVLEQVLAVLEHIDNRDNDSDFLRPDEGEQLGTAITALWAILSQEEQGMTPMQRIEAEADSRGKALATEMRASLSNPQEQTITVDELAAALGWPGGISTPVLDKTELLKMVASTRVARQEQEPVAWRSQNATPPGGFVIFQQYPQALADLGKKIEPLYTHPPRREWQGLRNKEIVQIVTDNLTGGDWVDVARAIEQALRSKNNG